MKKFFSSGGGNDHQSSFVGKTLVVGRCQCVVEEVIAEGNFFAFRFLTSLSVSGASPDQ